MERLKSLYQLQQLDNEESEIQARLSEIEALAGDSPALQQARLDLEQAEEQVKHWTLQQQDIELQAGSLKQKITESEQALYSGSTTNPKELSERQSELTSLKRRLENMEEELLEAMIEREEAEAISARAQTHLEQAESEWSKDQQDLLSEKESLQERLEKVTTGRDELVPGIPADDLRVYQNLRGSKGGSAVALIQGGICAGCGMEVPSARLARAGEKGLFFCGNCERILLPE